MQKSNSCKSFVFFIVPSSQKSATILDIESIFNENRLTVVGLVKRKFFSTLALQKTATRRLGKDNTFNIPLPDGSIEMVNITLEKSSLEPSWCSQL